MTGKMVTSACRDRQHAHAYLQPFLRTDGRTDRRTEGRTELRWLDELKAVPSFARKKHKKRHTV